jgi:hypothetical protein
VTGDAFARKMIKGDFVLGRDGRFRRVTPAELVPMVG